MVPNLAQALTLLLGAFLFLLLTKQVNASSAGQAPAGEDPDIAEKQEKYIARTVDWIGENVLGAIESMVDTVEDRTGRDADVEGRKKKKKLNRLIMPLIIGVLLIKSILLPLTLKALAVLSGKAVILSLMSLILAAIMGLRRMAGGGGMMNNKMDYGYSPVSKYRRKDMYDNSPEPLEEEELYRDGYRDGYRDPYRYYSDRRNALRRKR